MTTKTIKMLMMIHKMMIGKILINHNMIMEFDKVGRRFGLLVVNFDAVTLLIVYQNHLNR